jgi:hypothetical protein
MSEPTSPTDNPKASVAKVATLATLGVLLFGALVGGGLYWSLHRVPTKSACPPAGTVVSQQVAPKGPELQGSGWTNIGDAAILKSETAGSAYYSTLGGRCEYWLIVRGNTLYAYKARLPGSTCAIIWNQKSHSFICHSTKELVSEHTLPRWPAREITSGPNKGNFEIDFA